MLLALQCNEMERSKFSFDVEIASPRLPGVYSSYLGAQAIFLYPAASLCQIDTDS
jgi:hypothetical protein